MRKGNGREKKFSEHGVREADAGGREADREGVREAGREL